MVYTCTLSPELQLQAKNELHEDPERRQEDIEHIRKWIKKQPHLNIRNDDMFILRFLRGCKFSLEKTKEKIDMHYTVKAALPEWFIDRDPQNKTLREILNRGVFLPLIEHDDKERTVILFRQGSYKPEDFHLNDITKAIYMLVDVLFEVNEAQSITGFIDILDMEGLTAGHMLQYPIPMIKKSSVLWQDAYAMRIKGLHYINAPAIFDSIFNTFKIFMNEKIKKRITVHRTSNLEDLYKEVPRRILPKEYGGETYTLQQTIDHSLKMVDAHRQWLLDDQSNTVNESKRPGKPKKMDDIFGLDGSFRKLNVD